jgi:hypothetical protein
MTLTSPVDRSLRSCASSTSTSRCGCCSPSPHNLLGLTYTRHWRLFSALALPTTGRISRSLAALSHQDRELIRRPHPDLLEVLDPRATSVLAAELLETIGPTSMLIAETLAAAIHLQSDLYFGDSQNAMRAIDEHAATLGVSVVIVTPPS